MGNKETKPVHQEKKGLYKDSSYYTLNSDEIIHIKNTYKIIEINWFDSMQVSSVIFNDEYFKSNPYKIKVLEDMVEHFYTHIDKSIYVKKTNYLCNRKERICICNLNANNFRKIYDGENYDDNIYSAWVKKINEPF
jgi:hypothetical protein